MGTHANPPPPNLLLGQKYYQGKGAVMERVVTGNFKTYARALGDMLSKVEVTAEAGMRGRSVEVALAALSRQFKAAHRKGNKVIFVGNGGSAAIASHMATDYSKNGGVRSLAFSDYPTLTCLANDFGYQNVYAKQIEYHGRKGDVAVIVSTSGRSLNIIAAADAARVQGFDLIATFTGMNPNNILRQKGTVNFYVPCADYGIVEIAHLTLLHSIIGR